MGFKMCIRDSRSVPVLESYGVGIDFILCRDNKVCRDVCESLVPAGEGVALSLIHILQNADG